AAGGGLGIVLAAGIVDRGADCTDDGNGEHRHHDDQAEDQGLDVISGGEPSGPYAPKLPGTPFASAVGADPGKLRIGVRVPSA
ncbi:hypothetical protein PXH80_33735, partial [Mycolicibacterium smegmatis]|uniref:hypothetical protein n=1 Tax=Mycolicibacterium smegmatis TaxID=1772 RepID=UPI0023DC323B